MTIGAWTGLRSLFLLGLRSLLALACIWTAAWSTAPAVAATAAVVAVLGSVELRCPSRSATGAGGPGRA